VQPRREIVYDLTTGQMRPALAAPPVFTSAATGWDGVLLEHHTNHGFETGEVASPHHLLVVHLGAPSDVEWCINGEVHQRRSLANQIGLIPAGVPFSCRSSSETSCLALAIEPRFVDGMALDLSGTGWVELVARVGVTDPLVSGIVIALRAEASAGEAASRLYGESLSSALAVHLAKEYSASPGALAEPKGGLTRHQLRTAMDYFHTHLGESISLANVATAVGISPFHFARRFRRSTGIPPHRYLIRLRVQRARELLQRGHASLAEVAVQVGFYDQSHLATHFKSAFGVTPGGFVARRRPCCASSAAAA